MKPKSFFETLYTCAFLFGYPAIAFWFIMLYLFLMPYHDIRSVVWWTLWYGGLTISVISPVAAYFLRDIELEITVSDRKTTEDRLTAVLRGIRYRPIARADNLVVFELPGFLGLWKWPISLTFGADDGSYIVGPASAVRLVLKRFQGDGK